MMAAHGFERCCVFVTACGLGLRVRILALTSGSGCHLVEDSFAVVYHGNPTKEEALHPPPLNPEPLTQNPKLDGGRWAAPMPLDFDGTG